MTERANESDGYAIAAVAHLTGLDPHTIRAWERRYGAVRPRRTAGGTRRYADGDVVRLRLMKALTECGEPIRVAASLSDDELRVRLARLAGVSAPASGAADAQRVRLAILHPTLAAQMREQAAPTGDLEVCVGSEKLDSFVAALRVQTCDVLVLDLDALGDDPVTGLDACRSATPAPLAVVVYTFARRRTLARLARRGARLVRGPLSVAPLRRAILDLLVIERARGRRPAPPAVDLAPGAQPPERRFSDAQLARLAEIASAVDCECPNHLSTLVSSLLAFERYARDCESRSAADAALHARLARGTGHARARLEDLLGALCQHDGIAV